MRVAWFTARTRASAHPIDDTASLVAELGSRHDIELYDERRAHDFVWQQWRRPVDVCVYDLSDTLDAAFMWPYLLHYPGVLRLRTLSLQSSRHATLQQQRRVADDAAERAFGGRRRLRIPLTASRLTVVGDADAACALQDDYPGLRVRHAPAGVRIPPRRQPTHAAIPTFGIIGTTATPLVNRAAERARDAGARLSLRVDIHHEDAVGECDAIVSLDWPPPPEPPAGALVALAAGRPPIVYEVAVTARWPALDPQTWQPRGFIPDVQPVAISIDPRDAEQSLMHALRRLAGDAALRATIGEAARAWAGANATVEHAAAAWDRHLAEAARLDPPPLPPDWLAHLTADGTERTRAMLAEIGVTVDFLR
jgi:hypothetical protein